MGWVKCHAAACRVTLKAMSTTVFCCWRDLFLLPSIWHISLVTSCYFEVIYLVSDPLLEMPICFHAPVEPDNILMIQLLSDKFYF